MPKCTNCKKMTFNPEGPYVYKCRKVNRYDWNPYEERHCLGFDPRDHLILETRSVVE